MPKKENWKSYAYVFLILLVSMVVRAVIGSWRSNLNFEQSALIGVTTVLLVAPPAYHLFYQEELIAGKKRVPYSLISLAAVGMFLYFVAL
jgi:uncharacterized membrane protein